MTGGRDIVTAQALRKLATAIVSDAVGTPQDRVNVTLADASGQVHVTAAVPYLLGVGEGDGFVARAEALRADITRNLHSLSNRAIGQVDIQFSHAAHAERRRVL